MHQLMFPSRDLEVETGGGQARRRDRAQEWLQTHRYGFRVWLVLRMNHHPILVLMDISR